MDFKIQECKYSGFIKEGFNGIGIYLEPVTSDMYETYSVIVVHILNDSKLDNFFRKCIGYESSKFRKNKLINIKDRLSKINRVRIVTVDNIPMAIIGENNEFELINGRYDVSYCYFNGSANENYLSERYGIKIEELKILIEENINKNNNKSL